MWAAQRVARKRLSIFKHAFNGEASPHVTHSSETAEKAYYWKTTSLGEQIKASLHNGKDWAAVPLKKYYLLRNKVNYFSGI